LAPAPFLEPPSGREVIFFSSAIVVAPFSACSANV
jgi:hypothetical protein